MKIIRKRSFSSDMSPFCFQYKIEYIQGDQRVSVHLQITIQKSDAQSLFGHTIIVQSNTSFIT